MKDRQHRRRRAVRAHRYQAVRVPRPLVRPVAYGELMAALRASVERAREAQRRGAGQ